MGISSRQFKARDLVEGRYEIIKLLGEGGMGSVFLAEHTLIKRRVAIKILHPQLATDAHVVERFMNEARAAGTLGHPNIVESTDMGFTQDHVPYIVFEYLEGTLLTDEIYRVGGLPVRRAVRIAEQIADALRAAHDAGIVHRDLKSDNIFLTDKDDASDHVKVLDFGISRFIEAEDAHRHVVMGTPEFMAPEQITSPEAVDARADIYALGVILYEMLSARRPFSPLTEHGELQRQILEDTPPALERAPHGLSDLIVHKLLAKKPSQRPQTMGAVGAALEAFLTREDGTPVPRRRSASTLIPLLDTATIDAAQDLARDSQMIPLPSTVRDTPWPAPQVVIKPRAATMQTREHRKGAAGALYALAGAGVVVGALGLYFGLRRGGDTAGVAAAAHTAQPAAATTAPPPAPAAAMPARDHRVPLVVEVDAPNAQVVYRRRIAAAPMTTEIASSEIVELVEISARGYKTERFWLTVDRPTHLRAHLVKGSGLAEASEQETLVALGEATPTVETKAPAIRREPAPAAETRAAVDRPGERAPEVKQVATVERTVANPRKIGRAAGDPAPIAVAKNDHATPTRAAPTNALEPLDMPTTAAAATATPAQEPAHAGLAHAPATPAVVAVSPVAAPAVPAEPAHVVAPNVLASLRTSGDQDIIPPESIQTAMVRDEKKKVAATLKVCLSQAGEIRSVKVIKSSGYPAYDDRLVAGVHGWRYRGFVADGHAAPVCSAVTFVYKLQ